MNPRALNQSQHLLPSRALAASVVVLGAPTTGFSSGANMQITAVRARLSSEDVMQTYVEIILNHCFDDS